MRIELSRYELLALALFTAITVVCASLGWNYYDYMWWLKWVSIANSDGIFRVYSECTPPSCKAPYPPLAIMIFVAIYNLASAIHSYASIAIMKILLVAIPGLAIYAIIRRVHGYRVAILWLFSLPFIAILIALQFDVLLALFLALSLYLFRIRRYRACMAAAALATLVKQSAALVIPVLLLAILKQRGLSEAIKCLAVSLSIILAVVAPFMMYAPTQFIENVIVFHAHRFPQDVSLWAIPVILLKDSAVTIDFLRWGWEIPFLACYILLLAVFMRKELWRVSEGVALCCCTALLLFIAMNKIGNLNYLAWVVPLGLLALGSRGRGNLCISFYLFTSLAIALGFAPYIALLYIPPAVVGKPVFVVEDLRYWNATYILVHSVNPLLIGELSRILGLASTSLEIVPLHLIEFVCDIYALRDELMVLCIAVAQGILTALIAMLINAMEHIHSSAS